MAVGDTFEPTRLLRFPATNGREVVFSYAGQLYTVPAAGGVARRLTNSPGYAIFPHFSPDGSQIAFSAQYDGNTEVYVMPAEGGTPRRLTYTATIDRDDLADRMGPNNIVLGWSRRAFGTPGKPAVIFRSRMHARFDFDGALYAAPFDGDIPQRLPVPMGGFLSFSPDESRMAFNQVFREFRTWKDYRGGLADDIWILDFKTGHIEDISNNPAVDDIPMWGPDNRIYYLSDRDGRSNLFAYDLGTKATRQLTHFRDFDIEFPTLGPGAIVFQEAGYIWRYDLQAGDARVIPIAVREDNAGAHGGVIPVAKWITEVRPAPDGRRAVVVARGDVFTVPAKHGLIRDLTRTSDAQERAASWSPDGKWIAYLSDAAGEDDLYVRPEAGGPARRLTQEGTAFPFAPVWSPDSRRLLWADSDHRLRYVDLASRHVTDVARDDLGDLFQYCWSRDSQWIAFTRPLKNDRSRIDLYSLANGQVHPATDPMYSAGSPVFSDDGRYLLFVSERDFSPLYSDIEWDHVFVNLQRVYLAPLSRRALSPLAPQDDEEGQAADHPGPDQAPARVDPEGLPGRAIGLPIAPAHYRSLRMVGDQIYYLRTVAEPLGGEPPPEGGTLAVFDLKTRKETELGRCDRFEITHDGKRMLLKIGKDYGFVDLPAAKLELKDKLNFDGLTLNLDRPQEWREMYWEAWRQMRDFFFDPGMGGIDWPRQGAKYAALLPYVDTRYDLSYLLGELVGELHNSHTYVEGGDLPAAPKVPMGLLGAEVSRDPVSRAYRIDRILPGSDWDPDLRSPLTQLGLGVHAGDYILAVDGRPVRELPNLYAALIDKADCPVILRVNATPSEAGARNITIETIRTENALYYHDWVRRNRARVDARSGGRIGYVQIPDMGPDGLSEFARQYYPQLTKEALIIDDRANAGGNVSPMIIERLRRVFEMYAFRRDSVPLHSPEETFAGPLAVLINHYSASDGDLFPYRFRYDHLGVLIGERTWGGAVGIGAPLPLADGGGIRRPAQAFYTRNGRSWVVEGHGVDPDITVVNDPTQEFHGVDQQLDRAVDYLLARLKAAPPVTPGPPPYVDKRVGSSALGGGGG